MKKATTTQKKAAPKKTTAVKATAKKAAPKKAATASVASSNAKKRISFEISAEPGISVAIAGSFNDWDCGKKKLADKNSDGTYRCTMMLSPGTYEYKFFVNGTWCADPANPNFTQNDHGTLNSVIVVD